MAESSSSATAASTSAAMATTTTTAAPLQPTAEVPVVDATPSTSSTTTSSFTFGSTSGVSLAPFSFSFTPFDTSSFSSSSSSSSSSWPADWSSFSTFDTTSSLSFSSSLSSSMFSNPRRSRLGTPAAPSSSSSASASSSSSESSTTPASPSLAPAATPTLGRDLSPYDRATLRVGDRVDGCDTERVWRHAVVVETRDTEILIHYVGWASTWDEWVARDSVRLQGDGYRAVGDTSDVNNRRANPTVIAAQVAAGATGGAPNGVAAAVEASQAAMATRSAEEISWRAELKTGDLVDIRGDISWRTGDITEHRGDAVRVLPIGVEASLAVWVERTSDRLAMPRTRSVQDEANGGRTTTTADGSTTPSPPPSSVATNNPWIPSAAVIACNLLRNVAQQKDWTQFEVGDEIDCQDTVGKWYLSLIRDVKADSVHIHFMGWAETWDEWIPRNSPRLAIKGSHAVGARGEANSRMDPDPFQTQTASSYLLSIIRVPPVIAPVTTTPTATAAAGGTNAATATTTATATSTTTGGGTTTTTTAVPATTAAPTAAATDEEPSLGLGAFPIYVNNWPPATTENQAHEAMSRYGVIRSFYMPADSAIVDGTKRCYLNYGSQAEQLLATQSNGVRYMDRELKIELLSVGMYETVIAAAKKTAAALESKQAIASSSSTTPGYTNSIADRIGRLPAPPPCVPSLLIAIQQASWIVDSKDVQDADITYDRIRQTTASSSDTKRSSDTDDNDGGESKHGSSETKSVHDREFKVGSTIQCYDRPSSWMNPFHRFLLDEAVRFKVDVQTWEFLVLIGMYERAVEYIGIDQYLWAALQFDMIGVLLLIDHIVTNRRPDLTRDMPADAPLVLALAFDWKQFRCVVPRQRASNPSPFQYAIDRDSYECAQWLMKRLPDVVYQSMTTQLNSTSVAMTPLAYVLGARELGAFVYSIAALSPTRRQLALQLLRIGHHAASDTTSVVSSPSPASLSSLSSSDAPCEVDDTTTRPRRSLALLMAAAHGDVQLTQLIASRSSFINYVYIHSDSVIWTPLFLAIRSGKVDVVASLLQYGADPNLGVSDMVTPLRFALKSRSALAMVKLLLAAGAKPSMDPTLFPVALYLLPSTGPVLRHATVKKSVLTDRSYLKYFKLLIQGVPFRLVREEMTIANVPTQPLDGLTIEQLRAAVDQLEGTEQRRMNHDDVVHILELFIAHGVDVQAKARPCECKAKYTPNALMIAIQTKQYRLAERMIREWRFDVTRDMIDVDGRTILHTLVHQQVSLLPKPPVVTDGDDSKRSSSSSSQSQPPAAVAPLVRSPSTGSHHVPVPLSLVRLIIDAILASPYVDLSLLTHPSHDNALLTAKKLGESDDIRVSIESAVSRIEQEQARRVADAYRWSDNQIASGSGTSMVGAILSSSLTTIHPQLQAFAAAIVKHVPPDALTKIFNTALQSKVVSIDMIPMVVSPPLSSSLSSDHDIPLCNIKAPPQWHIWLNPVLSFLPYADIIASECTARNWRLLSRGRANVMGLADDHITEILEHRPGNDRSDASLLARFKQVEHMNLTATNVDDFKWWFVAQPMTPPTLPRVRHIQGYLIDSLPLLLDAACVKNGTLTHLTLRGTTPVLSFIIPSCVHTLSVPHNTLPTAADCKTYLESNNNLEMTRHTSGGMDDTAAATTATSGSGTAKPQPFFANRVRHLTITSLWSPAILSIVGQCFRHITSLCTDTSLTADQPSSPEDILLLPPQLQELRVPGIFGGREQTEALRSVPSLTSLRITLLSSEVAGAEYVDGLAALQTSLTRLTSLEVLSATNNITMITSIFKRASVSSSSDSVWQLRSLSFVACILPSLASILVHVPSLEELRMDGCAIDPLQLSSSSWEPELHALSSLQKLKLLSMRGYHWLPLIEAMITTCYIHAPGTAAHQLDFSSSSSSSLVDVLPSSQTHTSRAAIIRDRVMISAQRSLSKRAAIAASTSSSSSSSASSSSSSTSATATPSYSYRITFTDVLREIIVGPYLCDRLYQLIRVYHQRGWNHVIFSRDSIAVASPGGMAANHYNQMYLSEGVISTVCVAMPSYSIIGTPAALDDPLGTPIDQLETTTQAGTTTTEPAPPPDDEEEDTRGFSLFD